MRLLNTTTLDLHEFILEELALKVPFGYAILSHRWRDNEVNLKELIKKRKTSGTGYTKIVECCRFAKSRGFEWVWIDTCCIDKRSSSELSEAINSMWRWYSSARECYALLDDVTLDQGDVDLCQALRRSEWFTRGWTLQELIAPKRVIFVSKDWIRIGRKSKSAFEDQYGRGRNDRAHSIRGDWHSDRLCPGTMLLTLHEITRITEGVLLDYRNHLQWQSVAEKMSWMSGRSTTRVKDQAYCMLGLFHVNMPLLYGEGLKAFDRLQALILQSSSDETIFAWDASFAGSWRLLAQRPGQFTLRAGLRPTATSQRNPYSVTNQGLRYEFKRGVGVKESECSDGRRLLRVSLNCTTADLHYRHLCSMYLHQAACGHFIRRGGPVSERLPLSEDEDEHSRARDLDRVNLRKRPYRDISDSVLSRAGRDDVDEKDAFEVIIIHMGQEHHTACTLAMNAATAPVNSGEAIIPGDPFPGKWTRLVEQHVLESSRALVDPLPTRAWEGKQT